MVFCLEILRNIPVRFPISVIIPISDFEVFVWEFKAYESNLEIIIDRRFIFYEFDGVCLQKHIAVVI